MGFKAWDTNTRKYYQKKLEKKDTPKWEKQEIREHLKLDKMTVSEQIRYWTKKKETELLQSIRKANAKGEGFYTSSKTQERLEKQGKIIGIWSGHSGQDPVQGYWITKTWKEFRAKMNIPASIKKFDVVIQNYSPFQITRYAFDKDRTKTVSTEHLVNLIPGYYFSDSKGELHSCVWVKKISDFAKHFKTLVVAKNSWDKTVTKIKVTVKNGDIVQL